MLLDRKEEWLAARLDDLDYGYIDGSKPPSASIPWKVPAYSDSGSSRRQGLANEPDDRVRVIIAADEMQYGYQQHGQRLAEVDELKRSGMVQDRGRVSRVRLDHGGVPAGLQGT